jgi:hypothetical protein
MAERMPNYPEPVTPADTHPTGCIGCKVENGPHVWTPPQAAPVCDPDCEIDVATGRCIFCGTANDDDMVTWTCYQWPRQCGHDDDLHCMTTEVAIKQRLETFEVPDA